MAGWRQKCKHAPGQGCLKLPLILFLWVCAPLQTIVECPIPVTTSQCLITVLSSGFLVPWTFFLSYPAKQMPSLHWYLKDVSVKSVLQSRLEQPAPFYRECGGKLGGRETHHLVITLEVCKLHLHIKKYILEIPKSTQQGNSTPSQLQAVPLRANKLWTAHLRAVTSSPALH